jgi:hypothetical protein
MTLEQARRFVAGEIDRIESENPVGELRPWMRDACPAAGEHWGRVQQRIALNGRDLSRACLKGLDILPQERSEAQKKASASAGRRLAIPKAS